MAKRKTNRPTQRPKQRKAGLTQLRFKRVKDFKLMSRSNSTRFGTLGSQKWGDELHTFIADKRVTRTDVQRWMEKEPQVKELICESAHRPASDEIEPRRPVSRSSEGHTQSRSRRSRSQSLSSGHSQVSDHTLVSQTNNQNQNSAKNCEEYEPENPNFVSSSNPIPNVAPSFGNPPSTSQSAGNYSGAMEQQGPHSQPQTDTDIPFDSNLKNISTCFAAIKVLSNFAKTNEIFKTCHYPILKIYRKLLKIQEMNIIPETPRVNSPPVITKEEVDYNIYIGTTGTGTQDLDNAMNWEGSVEPTDEINLTSETEEQEDITDPAFLQIAEDRLSPTENQ